MAKPAVLPALKGAADLKGLQIGPGYNDGVGSTRVLAQWTLTRRLLNCLRKDYKYMWENGNGVKLFDQDLNIHPFDFYAGYSSKIGIRIEFSGQKHGVIMRLRITGTDDGPKDGCVHARLAKALLALHPRAKIPEAVWEIASANGCEILIPYTETRLPRQKDKRRNHHRSR